MGVFSELSPTHCPDLNFGRAVPSQDRPVVDEGHFQALTGAGNGSSQTGIAAAHDDEIVCSGGRGNGRKTELFTPKIEELLTGGGRTFVGILSKIEGVAPTVEAGEVSE